MTINLELFLNDLGPHIKENEAIYLFFNTYSKDSFRSITTKQKEYILKKYHNSLELENALKILILLPKDLSFNKIIKSIDYNLNFRNKFKEISFRKDFKIKKSNYTSPHEFYNGTQYDIFYKNEIIANFNFLFSFEKSDPTLRLKYMQGVKGKRNDLQRLSSKLNQDWMSKVITFIQKYSESKKINYVLEMPPKYNTASEKEYKRYAFENYLKRFIDLKVPLSKIDFKNVPKECMPEIKSLIKPTTSKKIIPLSMIKHKKKAHR